MLYSNPISPLSGRGELSAIYAINCTTFLERSATCQHIGCISREGRQTGGGFANLLDLYGEAKPISLVSLMEGGGR